MAEPRKRANLDLSKCAGLGLQLAAALVLGAYGGYKLDQWFRIEPFGLIGGCLSGLAAGMTNVIRTVNALSRPKGGGDEPP